MVLIAGITVHIDPHLYLPVSPSEPEQLLSFQMLWGIFMQLLMLRRGEGEKGRRMPGGHLWLRNPQSTAHKGTFKLWSSFPDQWIVQSLLATEALPDVLGVGWGLECGKPETGAGRAGPCMAAESYGRVPPRDAMLLHIFPPLQQSFVCWGWQDEGIVMINGPQWNI